MIISIKNLRVNTIIGTKKEERIKPQELIINIQINLDRTKAQTTDKLKDTLDYELVKNRIRDFVMKSDFFLIEHLANKITDLVLEEKYVSGVRIEIDKPEALSECESVSVILERIKK